MKISKYTTRLSVSDKSWLLYNAVTDRFVLYSKELDFGKQTDLDVLKKESEQFYEQLEKGGFVIPNDKDETEEVVKKGLENCKNDKEYYLIINPTLNCNFRCWYCYENHSGRKKMRPETVESVKRMIDRLCDTEHIEFLHLSFFGGEPLLYYIDTVKPIIGHVENLKKERGLGYSIHFTTNGYLITNQLIEDLKKVHANVSFQITLDGSKEEHDKVRRSASGSGSYDRILANIKKLLENGFHVGLRLNEVFDTPNESDDTQVKLTKEMVSEGLRLDHVSFRYKGFGDYVLKDMGLLIPKGKMTAIVGASGSGKTTLLKLLLGFYYPQQGTVWLDNDRMETIELDSWRKKCGVVMQDGKIFSGTVAENIAMADEQPNLERMQYAARLACIDERINHLPMKFQTRIGETGINLSGGEKQRLLIARAVYKNPEFVFFDEATSSLDATTERVIMHNLTEFYAERTVVVIAHRLSTVKSADNIVFIDKGRIVEQGTHEELIKQKGYYYTLVNNQLELNEKAV